MANTLPQDIEQAVSRAILEDVGGGDVTADLISAERQGSAMLISREPAVLCGAAWFDEVFRQLGDGEVQVTWMARDGDVIARDQMLCTVEGPARALLTGERTALNFLQTLSGTATLARSYAEAVRGRDVEILDTRKTVPGLRAAQKYAVHCGGCRNHRRGLYDAILIKENHILSAGGIDAAVQTARRLHPGMVVEVEVEDLEELRQALEAKVDIAMLDNFDLEGMRAAVALCGRRAKLEVSGNVDMEKLRAIADTGVDYISVGALTKHVQAVDLSMRFVI